MSKRIIDFLNELSANNNKSWFDAQRAAYEAAKTDLVDIAAEVISELANVDPLIGPQDPKKCVFRINRDVRFSKNKDPYKTNMGAFIVPGGKNAPNAGYYMHFEPGQSFVGGGIYAPQPDVLNAIRREIYYHAADFKAIIFNPFFQNMFGELMNEQLVNVPKGFPADFADGNLLKYKHYVVSRSFEPENQTKSEIVDFVMDTFKAMRDFNAFLNRAVRNLE